MPTLFFKRFIHLTHLVLSHNSRINGDLSWDFIKELKKLKHLDLTGKYISVHPFSLLRFLNESIATF